MNDYKFEYTKPKELTAYADGFKAGLAGEPMYPNSWSGKQTNFNKPLRSAWEHGRREGMKERDKADIVRQERLVEDHWYCDVCAFTNRQEFTTCVNCFTKRPTPEHEAAKPRLREYMRKLVAEMPDEETQDERADAE